MRAGHFADNVLRVETILFIAEVIGWVLAIAVVYQALGVAIDAKRFPPPGKRVDVGGRCIHIQVTGIGAGTVKTVGADPCVRPNDPSSRNSTSGGHAGPPLPTVILESGIAASSPSWRLVQPEVAKFARVVVYDRAGLGWSDMTRAPVTPDSILHDLRTALDAVNVKPPYIFVGHSFGGLIAQLFAARHREELAGLVLLDPPHPSEWHPDGPWEKQIMLRHGARLSRRGAWCARLGINRFLLTLLTAGFTRGPRAAMTTLSGRAVSVASRIVGEIRKLPRETHPVLKALWSQPKCFESMAAHLEALPAMCAEVAKVSQPGVLGDLPLVLITGNQHSREVVRLQEEVATLSTRGRHLLATNSGHWIQLDQPELVVEVLRKMLEPQMNH